MCDIDVQIYVCSDCKQPCALEKETFSYSGTHCTHGQDGVHWTGYWLSGCCGAEYEEFEEEE